MQIVRQSQRVSHAHKIQYNTLCAFNMALEESAFLLQLVLDLYDAREMFYNIFERNVCLQMTHSIAVATMTATTTSTTTRTMKTTTATMTKLYDNFFKRHFIEPICQLTIINLMSDLTSSDSEMEFIQAHKTVEK